MTRRNIFGLLLAVIGIIGAFAERVKYVSPELSSYDLKVNVRNTFGNGLAQTTDSTGLSGGINTPHDLIWDLYEQFLYATDHNGGGLMRKLIAVDPALIAEDRFGEKFNASKTRVFMAAKTVFSNVNMGFLRDMCLSASGTKIYATSENYHNIRIFPLSVEFSAGTDTSSNLVGSPSLSVQGTLINGQPGGCTPTAYTQATVKIDPTSGSATFHCFGTDNGVGSYARFQYILGMTLQTQGYGTYAKDTALFVLEKFQNRVRRVDLATNAVTTFATSLEKRGSVGLISGGITMNNAGTILYIALNALILKFENVDFVSGSYGGTAVPFVGFGAWDATTAIRGYQDGYGANTVSGKGPRFQQVMYMTRDGKDNLYVSDGSFTGMSLNTGNYLESIRRITSDGNVTTVLGKNNCNRATNVPTAGISWCFKKNWVMDAVQKKVYPGDYVDGSLVSVNTPAGIAVTKAGNNLFFNDKYNHMIRQAGCQTGFNLTFGMCVGSTRRPSQAPSYAPSFAPSYKPSDAPSYKPSYAPSFAPSFDPTDAPSYKPSYAPSYAPSCKPSYSPTDAPSYAPSYSPTFPPTGPPVNCNPLTFVKTTAGNGCPTSCDGAEFKASHNRPADSKLVPAEDVVLSVDFGSNALRKMIIVSGEVTTLTEDYNYHHPIGLHIDGAGNAYITDLHRVLKVDPANQTPSGLAEVLVGSGFPGDVEDYCIIGRRQLHGSAATAGGKTVGGSAGTTAGTGGKTAGGVSATGGKSASSVSVPWSSSSGEPDCLFNTPIGITSDQGHTTGTAASKLYVVDSGNNRIKMIDLTQSPVTQMTIAYGDDLKTPYGIVLYNNVLYITSFMGHYIINFDLDSFDGTNAVQLTTSNIYAGSNQGRFGHIEATNNDLLSMVTMFPTGITVDGSGILYFNEWFKVPGEFFSDGSSDGIGASGSGGSSNGGSKSGSKSAGGASSGGASKAGGVSNGGASTTANGGSKIRARNLVGSTAGSKAAGTLSGSKSAGSAGGSMASSSSASSQSHTVSDSSSSVSEHWGYDSGAGGSNGYHHGKTVGTAGSKAAGASAAGGSKTGGSKAGGSKAGGSKAAGASAGGSKVGSTDASSQMTSNLNPEFPHYSDIDWGHEPQFLHNVRSIDINAVTTTTIAGSRIPGIFEPGDSEHLDVHSAGLSFSSSSSGSGSGSSKTAGASKGTGATAGASKSAGATGSSGGSKGSSSQGDSSSDVYAAQYGSTSGAGSSFISELLGAKSSYIVGSYSDKAGLSSQSLSAGSKPGKGSGSASAASAKSTYFADGFYSYDAHECPICPNRRQLRTKAVEGVDFMTVGTQIGDYVEKGSFQDGYAHHAQFFKNLGLIATNDASTGGTIYVSDFGNNRIRNITCSSLIAPSFEPTFEPTALPTFTVTDSPTKAYTPKKAGKAGKIAGKNGKGFKTKVPKQKIASASIGGVNFDTNYVPSSIANIFSSQYMMVAIVAAGAALVAGGLIHFMYYRKYYQEVLNF